MTSHVLESARAIGKHPADEWQAACYEVIDLQLSVEPRVDGNWEAGSYVDGEDYYVCGEPDPDLYQAVMNGAQAVRAAKDRIRAEKER